jgi:HlyD family secretion protein
MPRHAPAAVALLLLLLSACAEPPPENEIRVSGHVEATEVRVAAEVGGRVLEVLAAVGDRVEAGDVVVRLDSRDVELETARAEAERAAAEAQLRLLQAGARAEDVRQAEAQVAAIESETAAIDAELAAAEVDRARFAQLVEAEAGARKTLDDATARVGVLTQRAEALRGQARAARAVVARLEAGARPEELDTASARVAAIDAELAVLQERVDDATIVAPAAGVVTESLVEPGELAASRAPLLIITDLDRAWANLFVPEPAVPRITVGQAAEVLTDAGDVLPGTVSYIAPQAEFTPRNVQTADERSRLVYRIEVSVDNTGGVLKPGMPVDATLVLR